MRIDSVTDDLRDVCISEVLLGLSGTFPLEASVVEGRLPAAEGLFEAEESSPLLNVGARCVTDDDLGIPPEYLDLPRSPSGFDPVVVER